MNIATTSIVRRIIHHLLKNANEKLDMIQQLCGKEYLVILRRPSDKENSLLNSNGSRLVISFYMVFWLPIESLYFI